MGYTYSRSLATICAAEASDSNTKLSRLHPISDDIDVARCDGKPGKTRTCEYGQYVRNTKVSFVMTIRSITGFAPFERAVKWQATLPLRLLNAICAHLRYTLEHVFNSFIGPSANRG